MLQEKVKNTIKKNELLQDGDTIIIGVSGGPDSMALFHILYTLQKELHIRCVVAHVNHGIRKEAVEEENYVKSICENWNVPFYSKRVDIQKIAKEQKIGTEEAGRAVRYAFFEEIRKKEQAHKIATAHNANDRAETVLMHLIRGCGIHGLKGMDIKRDHIYIRPLLESSREEIEAYCEKHHLQPKIDQTNQETIYTRNKIRNCLIPYIQQEFNPNIIQTLNRLACVAQENETYFEKEIPTICNKLTIQKEENQIVYSQKDFNPLEPVIKKRVVLYTINTLLGNKQSIEKKHIEDILTLCSKNIGNKYLVPHKGIKILVKKQKIFFMADR